MCRGCIGVLVEVDEWGYSRRGGDKCIMVCGVLHNDVLHNDVLHNGVWGYEKGCWRNAMGYLQNGDCPTRYATRSLQVKVHFPENILDYLNTTTTQLLA